MAKVLRNVFPQMFGVYAGIIIYFLNWCVVFFELFFCLFVFY